LAAGLTLFLCGDVMTGRGVDQALPFHCEPTIYEDWITDSRDYVLLSERAHGPIRRPIGFAELWGDALAELERAAPAFRLINLETSVTTSDDYWRGKGINYRMHPGNVPCLSAAGIDCCALANNHVLDWGYAGLRETLEALRRAGIGTAGAGRDQREAEAPQIHELGEGRRILVVGAGDLSSGIPAEWAAGPGQPGVNLLPDLSRETARAIGARLLALRRPGDLVVFSVHWGGNWQLAVPDEQLEFAHALIDSGGVDLVQGHSSHHVKGIEVYRRKLVLYGCGDLLDDYEGIGGHEGFRGDLGLMYFPSLDADSGRLLSLEMVPTQVRQLRLRRASSDDARWLRETLEREGRRFETSARIDEGDRLALSWE
jgi:poly-gamma-glutamate synthesis protein (capsule biosynthesis protein)